MTDEDAQLRRLLASAAEAPEDDAFLAQVEQRIKRVRRTRRIIVAGVTLVLAVGLGLVTVVLDVGQQLASGIAFASQGATALLLSPVGILLAIIASIALAAARRR